MQHGIFFHGNESAYLLFCKYEQKNNGLNTSSHKISVLSFQNSLTTVALTVNCVKFQKNCSLYFIKKFPYKRCILCFNFKLMRCPIITYPPRNFIYLLPITTTRKRIRNSVDVVVHLVASREKRHEL